MERRLLSWAPMSWTVGTLGVLATMVVGCASSYGEAESTSLPERSGEASAQQKAPKKTTTDVAATEPTDAPKPAETKDAPPAQVVAAAPTSIAFSWNRVSPTAEYSFDVLTTDGHVVGPCIGVQWIHRQLTTTFRGTCPDAAEEHQTIAMTEIEGFQLCSAEDNDWDHATCTKVIWDGLSATVTFDNGDRA